MQRESCALHSCMAVLTMQLQKKKSLYKLNSCITPELTFQWRMDSHMVQAETVQCSCPLNSLYCVKVSLLEGEIMGERESRREGGWTKE